MRVVLSQKFDFFKVKRHDTIRLGGLRELLPRRNVCQRSERHDINLFRVRARTFPPPGGGGGGGMPTLSSRGVCVGPRRRFRKHNAYLSACIFRQRLIGQPAARHRFAQPPRLALNM